MSVYRRFIRAKKGMSTIFGGLFFIILILMGFNLLVWGFIQYDSYNTSLRQMSQNDALAAAENLVPTNPGAQNFSSTSFNMPVNNLGGTTVSIARIYITNFSPTGSTNCTTGPCIVDAAPGTSNCTGNGLCFFTNGNVAAGEINHLIHVTMPTATPGLTLNDGSGWKVILASTRGRLFSFFYPWPVALQNPGNPGGNFVTNIGPLSIYFNTQSFNFTQGSQTQSQSAFCIPTGQAVVFYVKITNNAQDSAVTLRSGTAMQIQGYGIRGNGQVTTDPILNQTTPNPNNVVAYSDAQPTVLPPAPANGAAGFTIVKFGTGGAPKDANYLTFIGFFYIYQTHLQGETIPFIDFEATSAYPAGC